MVKAYRAEGGSRGDAGRPQDTDRRTGNTALRRSASPARAGATLARPRPVWVLDDPFSAVDPATEDEILRNLRELGKDRIILLISHRLTHFAQFDQVLWLENGTAG